MKPTIKNQQNQRTVVLGLMITLFTLTGCGGGSGGGSVSESGGASGEDAVAVSNTANSPAEMSVGDVYYTTFEKGSSGEIDFAGVDSSADFILGLVNVSSSGGSSTVSLTTDESLVAPNLTESVEQEDEWEEIDPSVAFHSDLRLMEAVEKVSSGGFTANKSFSLARSGISAAESVRVGGISQMRILKNVSSTTQYSEVDVKAICARPNVVLYLDVTNPSDTSEGDVESHCNAMNDLVAKERTIFGTESDVNEDGRISAVFSPVVNGMTKGLSGNSSVTGFFFHKDLSPRDNSNLTSNEQEVVYLSVADESAIYGPTVPKAFFDDYLARQVFIHEVQHIINYNLKTIINKVAEEVAVNEGTSHLAEDLVDGYGNENHSRSAIYLNKTQNYQLFKDTSLGGRGGMYLFLRWLYEQSGDGEAFIWNLTHSERVGIDGVAQAYRDASASNETYSDLMLRFSISTVMSNQGISKDPYFSFQAPTLDPKSNRISGAVLLGDAKDGRGTFVSPAVPTPYYGFHSSAINPNSFTLYNITSLPNRVGLKGTAGKQAAYLIRTK